MPDNKATFEAALSELYALIIIFVDSGEMGVKEILDDDIYRKKYSRMNIRKLIKVLEKYKDDKIAIGEVTSNVAIIVQ